MERCGTPTIVTDSCEQLDADSDKWTVMCKQLDVDSYMQTVSCVQLVVNSEQFLLPSELGGDPPRHSP